MPNKAQLDREAYAKARALGLSRAESAERAGCKAKALADRSKQGTRLETEEGVLEMIEDFRRAQLLAMDDDWKKSQAVMSEMLLHGDWKARAKAAEFFGKCGGFVTKHEHTGNDKGPIVLDFGKMLPTGGEDGDD